jgi:hypothetical protein
MPTKTADLRQAMRASAKSLPNRTETDHTEAQPAPIVNVWPVNPHYRPGRANKSNVTGYFPPEVKKQLRFMSAEQDKTIQKLLAEALNDLFAKYGKPEIAPMEDTQ